MKVAFYTLGCKVNQYETEALKTQFRENNHIIVDTEDLADAYVINTCTVTRLADRKSRQYIRRMKKKNPDSIIAVTGCYAQISPQEIENIEEVDIITGTNKKNEVVKLVEEYEKWYIEEQTSLIEPYENLNEYIDMGVVTATETRTRAYIKVQEGCNRFCSYCIIPYARGQIRSRELNEIVKEAKALIKKGFKELVLTGINTALYGSERNFFEHNSLKTHLQGIEIVIDALNKLDGDFRIRLSSLEPTVINKNYVENLFKYEKLCPHLHLSAQSGSTKVLRDMRRNYKREDYLDIVKKLKDYDRGFGITTDIIVGFPGENSEDFQNTLDLVDEVQFCKVHIFKYSKRKGTIAEKMPNQVDGKIKNERSQLLTRKSEIALDEFFGNNINTKRRMLVEEYLQSEGCLVGYTENYIKCYISCVEWDEDNIKNKLNEFVEVELKNKFKDGMEVVVC